MRFRWSVLPLLAVSLSASAAELRSYWIPIEWGMQDQAVPVKPITAPRQVLIWNQFGEGHFGARLFELEEVGDTGTFRRLPQRRVYTLGGFATSNDQERCSLLLGNSVMKRIDSTSFHDMGGIGYFPNEPEAFDRHLESGHSLHYNQLTYFESTSWLTAKDLKETFGGKIPWGRVVEILAEPGLSLGDLKARVEIDGDTRVRFRRATLRLVAGQNINDRDGSFFNGRLPLEDHPPHPRLSRGQTPFLFELGRASQLKGLKGEAELLVPFAIAAADHQRELFHPYPSDWEQLPPDAVGFHVLSLDRAHTLLFRRRLGMTVTAEQENHSVLSASLPQMLEKQKPSSRSAALASIHAAVPGRYSELGAIGVLRAYRSTFRRDFDLTGFTDRMPLVVRDYSPGFNHNLRQMLAPSWKPITDADFVKLRAALESAGQLLSEKPFDGTFRDDVGEGEWKKAGLAPVVISNFDEILAGKSSDYLANVLLAFLMNWWPENFPAEIADHTTVAVATEIAEVGRQATLLGFKKLDDKTYSIPLRELARLVAARPDLTPAAEKRGGLRKGQWMRRQLMGELYGF